MSRLSREEKLKIIEHFLLSTPPGEFEDVLADVKELVNDDDLINDQALETFRKYNIEQLIPVTVNEPSSHKLILSTYAQISDNEFLDPIGAKIVTVNHTLGTVESVREADPESEPIKAKRTTLQSACDDYVKERYIDGISNVFPNKENDMEFFICISSSKFNERNFWSGRWRSVYRVTYLSDTKIKISGSMKVNVHYYEDGNIQLNTSREFGDEIAANDAQEIGKKVFKALETSEGKFQDQIDQTCQNLSQIFKALRRRLPVTHTEFDFASSQHELVKNYTKGK